MLSNRPESDIKERHFANVANDLSNVIGDYKQALSDLLHNKESTNEKIIDIKKALPILTKKLKEIEVKYKKEKFVKFKKWCSRNKDNLVSNLKRAVLATISGLGSVAMYVITTT